MFEAKHCAARGTAPELIVRYTPQLTLRRWTLGITARRAALPKGAQAKLRELTIEHQNSIKQSQMAAA